MGLISREASYIRLKWRPRPQVGLLGKVENFGVLWEKHGFVLAIAPESLWVHQSRS